MTAQQRSADTAVPNSITPLVAATMVLRPDFVCQKSSVGSEGLHVLGHILSRPSELDLAMLHVACSVGPLQLLQPVRYLATKQLTVCILLTDCSLRPPATVSC